MNNNKLLREYIKRAINEASNTQQKTIDPTPTLRMMMQAGKEDIKYTLNRKLRPYMHPQQKKGKHAIQDKHYAYVDRELKQDEVRNMRFLDLLIRANWRTYGSNAKDYKELHFDVLQGVPRQMRADDIQTQIRHGINVGIANYCRYTLEDPLHISLDSINADVVRRMIMPGARPIQFTYAK